MELHPKYNYNMICLQILDVVSRIEFHLNLITYSFHLVSISKEKDALQTESEILFLRYFANITRSGIPSFVIKILGNISQFEQGLFL